MSLERRAEAQKLAIMSLCPVIQSLQGSTRTILILLALDPGATYAALPSE
jgi:hypothetical protein